MIYFESSLKKIDKSDACDILCPVTVSSGYRKSDLSIIFAK